jgi:hypothetical protein
MGLTAFAASAAFGAASSYNSAKSQKSALNSSAWADQQNAKIADWQASQAIESGQTREEGVRLEAGQVYGRERAGLAASGVDLGYGSASDILTSTKLLSERDALTVHDNALRQAWGYRTQGTNYLNKAAMEHAAADSIKPWMSAFGSLLGSASKSGFDFSSFRTDPAVTMGSNPNGYNGTMNNPSAYVGG